MGDSNNLEESLKPFYQRASEAEERLARLEISVASKTDSKNEELERTVAELQSKLKDVTAELKAEEEKGDKQFDHWRRFLASWRQSEVNLPEVTI
ncbi:hypothetical protein K7X08_031141 [Anisodus acutangulus]|uniref:Uncharacterized protein n=1 Tax=Anisodus acutangulus TaxID=402998 RepID=A0A9Q1MLS8_9SOLA|nr:hypothetical protein K7X08_031141 [Anisodus acutangulus]